jgi:hypothetical protein
MAGSAAKVVISERQQKVLRKLSTATKVAKRLVQRATIILLAFSGVANLDIAKQVGPGRCQVGIWRRRLQDAFANPDYTAAVGEDVGTSSNAWAESTCGRA